MCNFKIPFSGDAKALISRAKREIESAGGMLSGDENFGEFMGKSPIGSIGGSYSIVGNELIININKKPLLLSCKRIEKELRGVMH